MPIIVNRIRALPSPRIEVLCEGFQNMVSVRLLLMSVSNGWCIVNESLGNKMLPTRKIFVTDMSVFLFIHSLNMSLDAIILSGGLVNMLTITVEEYMIAVVYFQGSCFQLLSTDVISDSTSQRLFSPVLIPVRDNLELY